jgi:glucokinase
VGGRRAPARSAVGIDLGGTNFRAAVFHGARRTFEHREEVGDRRDPASIVRRIAAVVDDASPRSAPVGIGIAAMLRGFDGVVAHSPHLRWRDTPFGDMLRAALPGRRVLVVNDVNAVTYGEYAAGAGRGTRDIACVFVGTGIGGGVVAGGRLLTGFNNTGAELGHIKVVTGDAARRCNCGLRGCVEAYAGGSYLLARIRDELTDGLRSTAVDLAGGIDAVTPAHIDRAAAQGDPYATALWHEVAPLLGLALANVCTAFNPERLILGGGVLANAPTLRSLAVEACLPLINPPARTGLSIVDAELGDDAGITGAALLAGLRFPHQSPRNH